MKKLFFLMALLLTVCGTVHAQYMLKVQLKDGSHELFEIDCTDNVNWEQDWRDPDRVFMMVVNQNKRRGDARADPCDTVLGLR